MDKQQYTITLNGERTTEDLRLKSHRKEKYTVITAEDYLDNLWTAMRTGVPDVREYKQFTKKDGTSTVIVQPFKDADLDQIVHDLGDQMSLNTASGEGIIRRQRGKINVYHNSQLSKPYAGEVVRAALPEQKVQSHIGYKGITIGFRDPKVDLEHLFD